MCAGGSPFLALVGKAGTRAPATLQLITRRHSLTLRDASVMVGDSYALCVEAFAVIFIHVPDRSSFASFLLFVFFLRWYYGALYSCHSSWSNPSPLPAHTPFLASPRSAYSLHQRLYPKTYIIFFHKQKTSSRISRHSYTAQSSSALSNLFDI